LLSGDSACSGREKGREGDWKFDINLLAGKKSNARQPTILPEKLIPKPVYPPSLGKPRTLA
jgi:hypothetical protein